MNFIDISMEINDVKKFTKFLIKNKSNNVRPSSLIKDENYLIFIYNHVKTESPYVYCQYIGCGKAINDLCSTNLKIVDMTNEYYWFKAFDIESNEYYVFGAHVHDNKLCVTNSSRRISFKKFVDIGNE